MDDPTADAEESDEGPQQPAAPAAEASPTKPEATDATARSTKSTADVLDMPVGRNFSQIRIQEVVDYLTEATAVRFELDMKSLWFDQGTTRNVPVTLQAQSMPVREFLDEVVVKRLKAAYVVLDDKIVITSRKAGNKAAPADNR